MLRFSIPNACYHELFKSQLMYHDVCLNHIRNFVKTLFKTMFL